MNVKSSKPTKFAICLVMFCIEPIFSGSKSIGAIISKWALEPNLFSKGQLAIDLIYHPISTPWMEALRDLEVEAHGGLSMLIFQAARAFKLWTGKEAPVDAMRKAAVHEIENKAQ